jgi:hypothetical protein
VSRSRLSLGGGGGGDGGLGARNIRLGPRRVHLARDGFDLVLPAL